MNLIFATTGGTLTSATEATDERVLRGIVLRYGEVGRTSAGRVRFLPGSLTRSLTARSGKVRLLVEHDASRAVGRLLSYEDGPDELAAAFAIASTPAGDVSLTEARERIRDGLSVGVDVLDARPGKGGVLDVTQAALWEVSQVAIPAFDDSRLAARHELAGDGPDGHDPRLPLFLLNLPRRTL